MKKLLLLVAVLCFVLFGQSAYAQKLKLDDVPGDVQQSFEFEHPGGKVSQWTLSENCYVATFKEDGSVGKCFIANDGTWVKDYFDIPKNSLPTNVMEYVKSNYPNCGVSVARLQSLPQVQLHYYVEVKEDGVGKEPSVLTFTDKGALMERKDPEGFVAYVAPQPQPKPTKAEEPKVKEKAEKADKPEAVAKADKPAADKAAKTKQKKGAPQPVVPKELNPSSIPPAVTKALSKKVQRPEELKWYKEKGVYVAKCIAKLRPTEVYITPEGVWEKTYVELGEESVTGAMLKHINNTYKGYKFVSAKKEIRADKQDKTYVEIYEKANKKSKLVTAMVFDKTGKLIRTIDPEYAMGEDDRFGSEKDLDKMDKMYKNIDMGDAEEDPLATEINQSNLPYQLQQYVKQHYPNWGYKSCSSMTDDDLGTIYVIEIKPEGVTSKYETLYFDYNGKYLKRVTKEGLDADEVEAEEAAARAEAEAEAAAEAAELAAEAAAEAGDDEDAEPADANIPAPVKAAFKAKYASKVPEWKMEDGNYVAEYQGVRSKEYCYIKPDGTILETHTTLDPANVTVTIQNYLKENYKGSKVVEYYTVKATDRKNYYKVVIRPKKSTTTDTLWFTTSGKITYHW